MTAKEEQLTTLGRQRTEAENRAALARVRLSNAAHAARREGMPVARIAQLAGVSRQAIYDILGKGS